MDEIKLDAIKAQEIIETDKRERESACAKKFQDALSECKCNLVLKPFITDDGRIDVSVTIKAY